MRLDVKFKRIEDGNSIDNTNHVNTTMPSFNFSFKNKTTRLENLSLMYNSKKLEYNSKEVTQAKNEQNTLDSITHRMKIPEEVSDNIRFESSSRSHSRNFNIFDNKIGDCHSYNKQLDLKTNFYNKRHLFDVDAISEYSAKTPVCYSGKRNKITKSLEN